MKNKKTYKTKYYNPYKKHIPVDITTWAELKVLKRDLKLHSINEVIIELLKGKKVK